MCLSNTTVTEELRHRKTSGSPTSVITESEQTFAAEDSSNPKPTAIRQGPSQARERSALEKLFTSKEESHVFHVHKILGVSALVSYIYRFSNLGESDGNFGPNFGTVVFILHHWLLNASSFIFTIPQRRIRDGGFRIWPEYRSHSLVFASRALACMLLIWFEQKIATEPSNNNKPYKYHFMDLVIVLGTCAAADYGSHIQGNSRSNTVRGTTYNDPFGIWFASEMQFNLTALCLVGLRRYSMHLVAVAIIQLNSFLMTLRRKNVASHEVLTAAYGLLLVLGFWVGVMEEDYSEEIYPAGTIGSLAVILRMGPLHVNKYVLWTVLWLSLHVIRTYMYDVIKVEYNGFWLSAFIVTKAIATGLGIQKRNRELQKAVDPNVQARMVHVVMVTYALLLGYMYYRNIYLGELWQG
jgi:hypothetical protein